MVTGDTQCTLTEPINIGSQNEEVHTEYHLLLFIQTSTHKHQKTF